MPEQTSTKASVNASSPNLASPFNGTSKAKQLPQDDRFCKPAIKVYIKSRWTQEAPSRITTSERRADRKIVRFCIVAAAARYRRAERDVMG